MNIVDRFWSHTIPEPNTGCWLWTGSLARNGYGQFQMGRGRGPMYAHRFAWESTTGRCADGWFVCHHCDTRPCVNPAHLFLGTHTDNMRDAGAKGRLGWSPPPATHCKRGHEFTPENTIPKAHGRRTCRACDNGGRRRSYHMRTKGKDFDTRRDWYTRGQYGFDTAPDDTLDGQVDGDGRDQ